MQLVLGIVVITIIVIKCHYHRPTNLQCYSRNCCPQAVTRPLDCFQQKSWTAIPIGVSIIIDAIVEGNSYCLSSLWGQKIIPCLVIMQVSISKDFVGEQRCRTIIIITTERTLGRQTYRIEDFTFAVTINFEGKRLAEWQRYSDWSYCLSLRNYCPDRPHASSLEQRSKIATSSSTAS
jgi:hypothetical protein